VCVKGQSTDPKKFVSAIPRFEVTFPATPSLTDGKDYQAALLSEGPVLYAVQVVDWSGTDPGKVERELTYADLRKNEPYRSSKEREISVNGIVGREFDWTDGKSNNVTWVFVKVEGMVTVICAGPVERNMSSTKRFFDSVSFPSH